MKNTTSDRRAVEARFAEVFTHLGFITAYARRRGARDPDELAAEVMAIAWRRLADVPVDDSLPWLVATARNLLKAERRREGTVQHSDITDLERPGPPDTFSPDLELDPALAAALASLSDTDREAVLLIAWEDLTPAEAAASLGISATAFRVRLHRARKRLTDRLAATSAAATEPLFLSASIGATHDR